MMTNPAASGLAPTSPVDRPIIGTILTSGANGEPHPPDTVITDRRGRHYIVTRHGNIRRCTVVEYLPEGRVRVTLGA